jgi:hypothetical protein
MLTNVGDGRYEIANCQLPIVDSKPITALGLHPLFIVDDLSIGNWQLAVGNIRRVSRRAERTTDPFEPK